MDTIAAIATAEGRGGVAVVRVSGDDAFGICKRLAGCAARPGRISVRNVAGEDCVVLAFKAPHSYTCEDVVEFQCHGGYIAPRRILKACIDGGARLARRGEFTERAFLNGRLGYEAAEAVLDLIDARTERAAEEALGALAGKPAKAVRECYEEAVALSSEIEHALDIDEGELPEGFEQGVALRGAALRARLAGEAAAMRRRAAMRRGALVVLAGAPNAGKSSLFNALAEENRAIVSSIAGTTRDAIEAWVDIGGWPVRLVDTAGLRETEDEIEAEGVRRTEAFASAADILVAVESLEAGARAHAGAAHGAPCALTVHTKKDLATREALAALPAGALAVSAKTGEGLEALRSAIAGALEKRAEQSREDSAPCGAPECAAAALESACAALDAGAGGDWSAGELVLAGNAMRRAASILGAHIGAEYSADMLEKLFSRFCVGK